MEHKIIQTENYLLVLGGLFKKEQFPYIVAERLTTGEFHLWQVDNENDWDEKNQYEIIAHLPLNNSPILEGVPLLPPLEDEVEKLAEKEIPYSSSTTLNVQRMRFIHGYNKAKEKYKYTEEDMVECWKYASIDKNQIFGDQIGNSYMSFIQSLQQPHMPVGFESEEEQTNNKPGSSYATLTMYKTKTTTNSQGLTQWVGEWIY